MFCARPWLAMLLLATGAVRLGEPAPDFCLENGNGPAVTLADFQGKKEIVLLFGGEIPDRAGFSAQLQPLEAVLLQVNSENDPQGTVRRRFLGDEQEMTSVLIDRTGRVRRIQPLERPGDVVTMVMKWRLGKANYTKICASCHGSEGVSEPDSAVPWLTGIGNRLTHVQIRSKIYAAATGLDTFFVRGHTVTEADLDAVVVYIAGL